MPRTRKGAGRGSKSQEVNDALAQVKALQKRSRELLQKAGRDVRSVRHDVAQLKKSGMVSKRLNVRSYQPTRYMLNKIEKNRDILRGDVVAIQAPKSVRDKYIEKGIFEARGSRLIVPKQQASQRTRIKKGLVENLIPLGRGEMRQVILPYHARDMEQVAEALRSDPTLDGRKAPDEAFAFYIGRGKTQAFIDADELIDAITTKYTHLFKGKTNREAFRHFMLVRFHGDKHSLDVPDAPDFVEPWEGGPQGASYKKRRRPDDKWTIDRRLKRDALRQQKRRENENEAERTYRLNRQRIRSAQNRQRKFLGD